MEIPKDIIRSMMCGISSNGGSEKLKRLKKPIENGCTTDSDGKKSKELQCPFQSKTGRIKSEIPQSLYSSEKEQEWKLGRWMKRELCEEVGDQNELSGKGYLMHT